jgi:hypothetical protein
MNASGTVAANPSLGLAVMMSSFSGPSGSPFDAKRADYANPNSMTRIADPTNLSTGALSTGIGFGTNLGVAKGFTSPPPAYTIDKVGVLVIPPNFNDDYTVGVTKVTSAGLASATTSELVAIGGGRVVVTGTGQEIYTVTPYTAGFGLLGFGEGGSRDAGAGSAFTGFEKKMVTATGTVLNGNAIETGWVNRSGGSIVSGQSTFGSSTAASAAPA